MEKHTTEIWLVPLSSPGRPYNSQLPLRYSKIKTLIAIIRTHACSFLLWEFFFSPPLPAKPVELEKSTTHALKSAAANHAEGFLRSYRLRVQAPEPTRKNFNCSSESKHIRY